MDTYQGQRWVIEPSPGGKLVQASGTRLWVFRTEVRISCEIAARAAKLGKMPDEVGKAVGLTEAQFSDLLRRGLVGGIHGYCYAEDEGMETFRSRDFLENHPGSRNGDGESKRRRS